MPKANRFDELAPVASRMYAEGKTLAGIGQELGCSPAGVRKWLILAGVPIRQRGYGQNGTVRHDFFRVIDTDAKAWLLGFIGSDGNVNKKCMRIGLHRRDREILERVRDLIAPSHEVKDYEIDTGLRSGLAVHSVEMVRDLNRLGIVPRKSLVYKPWNGPPELMPAYWRGMIDGDGSWWCRVKNQSRWGVSLCGTRETCERFAEFAASLGAHASVYQRDTIYTTACTGTLGCQRIATALYANETISLARKRAKVEQVLAVEVRELRDWSETSVSELDSLQREHGTWSAVAKAIGTTGANLMHVRARKKMPRSDYKPQPTTWAHITAEMLRALRAEHGSWLAVADHLGTASGVVAYLRQRLGVTEKIKAKRRSSQP